MPDLRVSDEPNSLSPFLGYLFISPKMDDETMPCVDVKTYHCICSNFLLATTHDVNQLPARAEPVLDGALILPLPPQDQTHDYQNGSTTIHNLVPERKPLVIRREDGFEKRVLLRCSRCRLVIGYQLDETHFECSDVNADEVIYLLPGSVVETNDMKTRKGPETPSWAQSA
jgi:hypothetical protein